MSTTETKSFESPSPTHDSAGTGAQSAGFPCPVAPGDVIANKYRVERVLAAGGMGVVVAASHLQLDEQVAIKFLREEAAADAEIVERFAREARNAIKIKSEHVARVIDVGALPTGTPYMVMEYLHGEDLATFVRARGPLPLSQAVELMVQACEAISEAHALGIVHRDIKPANLFTTRRADGILSVKVLDFGISKNAAGSATGAHGITSKRVALGSPCYMSPEQLACTADVDARTDIWSLGVTLFELLTATIPFAAESTLELCGKVLRDEPASVRALVPSVPAGVETIIGRCLHKDREKRFHDVGELALALAPFGPERARPSAQRAWRTVQAGSPSREAISSLPLAGAEEPRDGAEATRVVWDQASYRVSTRRRFLPALTISGICGVVALVSIFAWRNGSAREPGPPPRTAEPAALSPVVSDPPSPTPPPPAEPPSPQADSLASERAATQPATLDNRLPAAPAAARPARTPAKHAPRQPAGAPQKAAPAATTRLKSGEGVYDVRD